MYNIVSVQFVLCLETFEAYSRQCPSCCQCSRIL